MDLGDLHLSKRGLHERRLDLDDLDARIVAVVEGVLAPGGQRRHPDHRQDFSMLVVLDEQPFHAHTPGQNVSLTTMRPAKLPGSRITLSEVPRNVLQNTLTVWLPAANP